MFEKKNTPDAYLDKKIEQSNRSPNFVIMSQSLDMIERMKGINVHDTVTFAGATLGYCPESFIEQMAGATLGLFLEIFPQDIGALVPGAPEELIKHRIAIDKAMAQSLFHRKHTKFSLGTMMDCKGIQKEIVANRTSPTRQIMRGQQKIIPDLTASKP